MQLIRGKCAEVRPATIHPCQPNPWCVWDRFYISGLPEYTSFASARGRCRNKTSRDYPRWGGRGIEFRFISFEHFYAVLGPKPSALHSLDRIDNKGHYEQGNVRWALPRQQMRNRSFKPNATGETGIYYKADRNRARRYQAVVYVMNKAKSCGCYATLAEAKTAIEAARVRLWAEAAQ